MDLLAVLKITAVTLGLMVLPGILLVAYIQRSSKNAFGLGALWGFGITTYMWTTTAILWRYDFAFLLGESAVFLGLSLYTFFRKKVDINPVKSAFRVENALLLITAFLLFVGPLTVLYLPFDTDAQGFGMQALTTQKGGTVDTLAPLYPELRSLYSPAYFVIIAFISDLIGENIPTVMLVFSHLNAFLIVGLALTVGRLLYGELFGLLFGLFFVVGLGLFTALMDAHYTTVLATLFLIGLIGFLFPAIKRFSWKGLFSAAFFLGLLVYCHPDTLIAFLIGFIPFTFLAGLSRETLRWKSFMIVMVGVAGFGVLFSGPWIAKILPFLWSPGIVSNLKSANFSPSLSHWTTLVLYQGGIVAILALAGAIKQLKERSLIGIFGLIWLAAVIDFGLFGAASKAFNSIGLDITRHFYPFGLSWNGAIVPLALLSALFLVVFKQRKVRVTVRIILVVLLVLLSTGAIFGPRIIEASKKFAVPIYGAFSTPADLDVFGWLERNSQNNATVLNYPGYIGHWLPVISNRRAVNFRPQPWFLYSGNYGYGEDISGGILSKYYLNPEGRGFYEALKEYGVEYVVVPQMWKKVIGDDSERIPNRALEMKDKGGLKDRQDLTWKLPDVKRPYAEFSKQNFLKLVFEKNGAQVFVVQKDSGPGK